MLFTVGLMAVLGVLAGLPPALRAVSAGYGETLGAGARSTSAGGRAREALAVLQIALALTLLVCALLLAESMSRLQRFDYGFEPDGVLTFRVIVDAAEGGAADLVRVHARLLEVLQAMPGVRSAAIAQELPGFDPRWQSDINPESDIAASRAPGELINVDWAIVSGVLRDARHTDRERPGDHRAGSGGWRPRHGHRRQPRAPLLARRQRARQAHSPRRSRARAYRRCRA